MNNFINIPCKSFQHSLELSIAKGSIRFRLKEIKTADNIIAAKQNFLLSLELTGYGRVAFLPAIICIIVFAIHR